MDQKYLISASSEYLENEDVLKSWCDLQVDGFSCLNDFYNFTFETILDNSDETVILNEMLMIQNKYKIPTITLWKISNEKNENAKYDIGLSYDLDGNVELLLGRWSDWTFNQQSNSLKQKDLKIDKLEQSTDRKKRGKLK